MEKKEGTLLCSGYKNFSRVTMHSKTKCSRECLQRNKEKNRKRKKISSNLMCFVIVRKTKMHNRVSYVCILIIYFYQEQYLKIFSLKVFQIVMFGF